MYSLTLGRGDPSAGPGGVFFFAAALRGRSLTHCGPGRRCLPPGWCFFFCCGPARTGVVFFCLLWPRRTLTHSLRAWAAMPPAGVVFFFLLRPRPDRGGVFLFAVAPPDAHSLSAGLGGDASRRGGVFFCCGPTRTGVVFFLLWPRPDAHSLTAGLGGDASRRGGVFFFAAAPPGPGWFFFFLLWPRPDAHSLTALRPRPDRGGVFLFAHSLTVGWGDFGKARVVFFLLRPRRTRRANNKKCLVYYIGSKKTGGATAKKKHHFRLSRRK